MTINEYKEKHNMTNKDLGDLIGIDKSTAGKLLTGYSKLSLNLYLKIKSIEELKDLDLSNLNFADSLQEYLNKDNSTNYNPPIKQAEVTVNKKEDTVIDKEINKEQFKGTLMQQIKISEALDQLKIIKEDIINLENILK